MGGTSYSAADYSSRMRTNAATNTDYFKHSDDVKSGRASGIHKTLDPSIANGAGKLVRESKDSPEHPTSLAISVLFDETGSMGGIPRIFTKKLGTLMAALTKKGYVDHPHIMFGAFGDATCDHYPLQLGQFEAGNEMDEALSNIILEGNGGGQSKESYELAMYYMARHTEIDCYDKRGIKGYLFLSGDEEPYAEVKRSEIAKFIGADHGLEANPTVEDILEELQERYHVFWLFPTQSRYWDGGTGKVPTRVRELLGQNMIPLEEPEDVTEVIVATIGITEGYDIHDIASTLKASGSTDLAVSRAMTSVKGYSANTPAKTADADGVLTSTGSDATTEL